MHEFFNRLILSGRKCFICIMLYFHISLHTNICSLICIDVHNLIKSLMLTDQTLSLNISHTILAHQKEINCVTISPNDKLIATASQDKTAKVCHCIIRIYMCMTNSKIIIVYKNYVVMIIL